MGFLITNLKIVLSSLLVAVVLFLAVAKGINIGKDNAQSQIVVQTAQNLSLGLQYFYSDQDRFPTALEYSEQNVMRSYFSVFPPADFPSTTCSQSLDYKRISPKNFQLNFCLPRAVGKYNQGWNTISNEQNLKN